MLNPLLEDNYLNLKKKTYGSHTQKLRGIVLLQLEGGVKFMRA